ncbi:hypothetical protein BJ741DRAFT_345394 [Chytriomyces cf. hyalinus JEL632]|nr:hypothetical protein BJ741DRAFT_345394 [Chytriomyces cf. hyalinus JEL632]
MNPPKSPAAEPFLTRETIASSISNTSGSLADSDLLAGGSRETQNEHLVLLSSSTLAGDALGLAAKLVAQEMLAATADFKVLEDLNNAARERYAEVVDDTLLGVCAADIAELNGMNEDLGTCSTQVLLLERQISGIEQVVAELDDYTKRLEDSVRRRIVYPYVTK